MASRLLTAGLFFLSTCAWANPANLARSFEKPLPKKFECIVDAYNMGQVIPDATLRQMMVLQEDGDSMTFNLYGQKPNFEVFVQYYKSEIEDDHLALERVQIAINDLKKDTQEDYISSSLKKMMYMVELDGVYTDLNGANIPFQTVSVECSPVE